jgi:hypothetical protein
MGRGIDVRLVLPQPLRMLLNTLSLRVVHLVSYVMTLDLLQNLKQIRKGNMDLIFRAHSTDNFEVVQ